jgi:hypothetical protein
VVYLFSLIVEIAHYSQESFKLVSAILPKGRKEPDTTVELLSVFLSLIELQLLSNLFIQNLFQNTCRK